MTPRTICWRIDMFLSHQFASYIHRITPFRLPIQFGNQLNRPDIWRGISVAFQAPAHAQRLGLGHDLHLVDAAVAGDAGHPGGDVRAVLEIGEVGELVHARPAHRPARRSAVADRGEQLAVALDQLVAVHARLRVGADRD